MPENRSIVLLPNQPPVVQKNACHSKVLPFDQFLQNPNYLKGNFHTQVCGKYQLLLSNNEDDEVNPLATQFRAAHCKGLDGEVRGTCVVVGVNDKGQVDGLSMENFKAADSQLKQFFGGQPKSTKSKAKTPGTVKPRSAEFNFKMDHKRTLRANHAESQKESKEKTKLSREDQENSASKAWDTASDEVKAEWDAKYNAELDLYNELHPKQPTRARTAFNMFKQVKGMASSEKWGDVTPDEKIIYEERSKLDLERYTNELKSYHAQCEKVGMDAGMAHATKELDRIEKRKNGTTEKPKKKRKKEDVPDHTSDME